MYLLDCYIEHPVRSIDRTFTYYSNESALPGVRVTVNFNRRSVLGFVESVQETDETPQEAGARLGCEVKPVEQILDAEPLITGELAELARQMKQDTLSTMISCYQAMLPSKVKPKTTSQHVVEEKWVRISEEEVSLTPKELEAYCFLRDSGPMRYSELRKQYPNQARQLVAKHAAEEYLLEKEAPSMRTGTAAEGPALNEEQQAAVNEIEESSDTVFLLYGQTGSGKTEVYLTLARHALEQGKQVLVLVPEIALTPQMIARISERFGEELAIYHSGLNPQEKYEQYRMVKSGKAAIVVGTRSAVFLPFRSLGLIVMDEEHDGSYKQDSQPAYHCRDAAVFRAQYHRCKLILGSATPSLESYARALKNVYHLVRLKHRVNNCLPDVTIVPLKDAMRKGQSYIITDTLQEKMEQTLAQGKQAILLLNRRGYHTMLRCNSCKEPLKCRHCDITLSYHHASRTMVCHSCGASVPVPSQCPSCHAAKGFSSYGYGTEKLEQEVRCRFPDARVLRMDADTTSVKNGHEKILNAFGRREADILVGTQMIAKGLDYPDVTLVGILNGDEGLSRTDYRSCEVTFDLLMQAAGRSGRADAKGEVVLQVFDPGHYAVTAAAKQDYDLFFKHEMYYRHAAMQPPYTYLISLTVGSRTEEDCRLIAAKLMEGLDGPFKTIGIIPLPKRRDTYRNRLILKGKDPEVMRRAVRGLFEQMPELSRKDIRIDVNPLTLE